MDNIKKRFGLSETSAQTLQAYVSLILRWNERIQMTATRDPEEFIHRHLADSLELAKDIPHGQPARMLDVGSGGGLPGVILAIVRPDLEMTLIEPTQKKHAFLSAARRELQLKNLQTHPIRDEELLGQDAFEPFDFAVARAVWAVDTWLARARPLVRPGGLIFAMEGNAEFSLPEGAIRRRYKLQDRERSIITLRRS